MSYLLTYNLALLLPSSFVALHQSIKSAQERIRAVLAIVLRTLEK